MSMELEALEQIAENDWTLAQSLEFIGPRKDPWAVLSALYDDGCIDLLRAGEDASLPGWRVSEVFRNRHPSGNSEILVVVTNKGVKRVYP